MTTKDIVDKVEKRTPISEEQKETMTKLIDMIWKEGYVTARTTAINAFDEMWIGTEENPADDEFEPDYDAHRSKFVDSFMWE
jgi:hypothetical protein